MMREVVKIDVDLCNGCGQCVPNCHEGALQIIDGKARLISDLLCDGLGACIGHCPNGAITIEKRDADDYDEIKNKPFKHIHAMQQGHGGCPGSQEMRFKNVATQNAPTKVLTSSELCQWPVQLHLVNPMASYFQKADILIAADCTAFALGNFHSVYLKGKALAIACPKLDSNKQVYVEKIKAMISNALANTITVLIMEVPCCSGLLAMIQEAATQSGRKIPIKLVVVGIQGEIVKEEWT